MIRSVSYASTEAALDTFTIGRLAAYSGVSVETIRFYERKTLLEQPPRPDAGYRRYGEDAVRRLDFIRRAKALGFTLGEIRELFELRVGSDEACANVEETAGRTIARIDGQIEDLTRMKEALAKLVDACGVAAASTSCPIIDALEDSGNRNSENM